MKENKDGQKWFEDLIRAQMRLRSTQEDTPEARAYELSWQKIEYHSNPENMTFQELINVDDL